MHGINGSLCMLQLNWYKGITLINKQQRLPELKSRLYV